MQVRSIVNTWPLAAAFMFCLAGLAFAQPARISPPDPIGEWLVAKRIARIKIVDCSGRLWGVVSWEAQPGIDTKNPDPNLRSRPTLGMPILLGMAPTSSNQWEGQIYNSEDGNTYSASITLSDPNTLRVVAKIGHVSKGKTRWEQRHRKIPQGRAAARPQPSPLQMPRSHLMMCAHGSRALRGFPMSAG